VTAARCFPLALAAFLLVSRRLGRGKAEQPFSKNEPEFFDVALSKAKEAVPHGVGAGKSLDA
jgi:hypothetical protein